MLPALLSRDFVDFLIVGGGIAGASVAYHLSKLASSIVLSEKETSLCMHSSGRSVALSELSYGSPFLRQLAKESREFMLHPPDDFNLEQPLLMRRGSLVFARHDQEDKLSRHYAESCQLTAMEKVDAIQVMELCPILRKELVVGGVYERDSMSIDVNALFQGYIRNIRTLRGRELISAASRDNSYWEVTFNTGEILKCGCIVNAAGAWGDQVAVRSNITPVGLSPLKRTAFTFPVSSNCDVSQLPNVCNVEETWYTTPWGAGQLMGSPADEIASEPCDVLPDDEDIALGIERIMSDTTLQITSIHSKWAGLRVFTSDREPVVGYVQEQGKGPGFVWVVGQGGQGVQSADALARWAALAATQRSSPIPQLSPTRFC